MRVAATCSGSMSASRMVSPTAPVASSSPSGSTMRLSPDVAQPAALAHPVAAHDVGEVLDGSRLQQRHPVRASRLGPVGRHQVHVGLVGQPPELVGEAQVVADERADPHAVDLDRHQLVAGAEVLVLAAVAERMDLAVAVHRAVGPGQHEAVVRARVAVVAELGTAAAHPHVVQRGLRLQELRRRPALGLGQIAGVSTAKPVENVSVSSTRPAPAPAAAAISGARRAKFAVDGRSRRCRAGWRRCACPEPTSTPRCRDGRVGARAG